MKLIIGLFLYFVIWSLFLYFNFFFNDPYYIGFVNGNFLAINLEICSFFMFYKLVINPRTKNIFSRDDLPERKDYPRGGE